jgi:hypothetical protein
MLQALQRFGTEHTFTIEVVDVDADVALVALYDELVPVLMASRNGSAPLQLCHYFLDEAKLKTFLEN